MDLRYLDFPLTHGNQGAPCLRDMQRRPKNSLCLLPNVLLGLCSAVTHNFFAPPASPSISSQRERANEPSQERCLQKKRQKGQYLKKQEESKEVRGKETSRRSKERRGENGKGDRGLWISGFRKSAGA